MTNKFIDFQHVLVKRGNQSLVDNIKTLLYMFDATIFDKLDFNSDDIYKEPLLFALFNSNYSIADELPTILFASLDVETQRKGIKTKTDLQGKIYVPNFGWFKTSITEANVFLIKDMERIEISKNDEIQITALEAIEFIPGTKIEILKYQHHLLSQFYYDYKGNTVQVEVEEVTLKHKNHLATAFHLIRENVPEHFQLIESVLLKVAIFNVDPSLRNSFATLSAQGIAFFNAYQENYNEVFFVDDIAHQTGHLIFNSLIYQVENFLKVSGDTVLDTVVLTDGNSETRDLYIIFHALYTYYATFICLDACLDAKAFNGHKKHEAYGRICFYIRKCNRDLTLIENPHNEKYRANRLFTEEGISIYYGIKQVFLQMVEKWGPKVKHFELDDQPYNFNYSIFLASNPLDELS